MFLVERQAEDKIQIEWDRLRLAEEKAEEERQGEGKILQFSTLK